MPGVINSLHKNFLPFRMELVVTRINLRRVSIPSPGPGPASISLLWWAIGGTDIALVTPPIRVRVPHGAVLWPYLEADNRDEQRARLRGAENTTPGPITTALRYHNPARDGKSAHRSLPGARLRTGRIGAQGELNGAEEVRTGVYQLYSRLFRASAIRQEFVLARESRDARKFCGIAAATSGRRSVCDGLLQAREAMGDGRVRHRAIDASGGRQGQCTSYKEIRWLAPAPGSSQLKTFANLLSSKPARIGGRDVGLYQLRESSNWPSSAVSFFNIRVTLLPLLPPYPRYTAGARRQGFAVARPAASP